MAIFSVYVVNKAGGLIYQYDSYSPRSEAEKTFSYPLDLLLKLHDERVLVAFGQRDGIRGGLQKWAGLVVSEWGSRFRGSPLTFRQISSLLPLQWATRCWPSMGSTSTASTRTMGRRCWSTWAIRPTTRCPFGSGRPRLTSNEKLMLASMFHS